jgi:hypothetical protein
VAIYASNDTPSPTTNTDEIINPVIAPGENKSSPSVDVGASVPFLVGAALGVTLGLDVVGLLLGLDVVGPRLGLDVVGPRLG